MSTKEVINTVYYLGAFLTHPAMLVGALKYLFVTGWPYPFVGALGLTVGLWVLGLGKYLYSLFRYSNVNSTLFYLRGHNLILIGILYATYLLTMAISIFQTKMEPGRYLMLTAPCDLLFIGFITPFILKRPFVIRPWAGFVIMAISYVIYEFTFYKGEWEFNFTISASSDDWLAPICCIASRAAFILMNVIAKRLLVRRGYEIKTVAWDQYVRQRQDEMERTAVDENGHIKKRVVRYDSVVFQRAMQRLRSRNVTRSAVKNWMQKEEEDIKRKVQLDKRRKELEIEMQNIRKEKDRLMKDVPEPAEKDDKKSGIFGKFTSALEENRRKIQKREAKLEELKEEWEELREEVKDLMKSRRAVRQEKSMQVETFLEDYEDMDFHMHIFDGIDDMELSKLDMIIENTFYDFDLCGISLDNSMEMHAVAGGLLSFPAAFFAGYFNLEIPMVWTNGFFGSASAAFWQAFGKGIGVSIGATIVLALRPFFLHKLTENSTPKFFFCFHVLCQFAMTVVNVYLVFSSYAVPANYILCIFLTGVGYAIYYVHSVRYTEQQELTVNYEFVKGFFSPEYADEGLPRLPSQLNEIREKLGMETALRVMIDMMASKNPKTIYYTANPYLPSRMLMDPEYYQRVTDWGGIYPRPWVEAAERTWDCLEGEKGFVLNDGSDYEDEGETVAQLPAEPISQIEDAAQVVKQAQPAENANEGHGRDRDRERDDAEDKRRRARELQEAEDRRRQEYEERMKQEALRRKREEEEHQQQVKQVLANNLSIQEKVKIKHASVIMIPTLMSKPTASVLRFDQNKQTPSGLHMAPPPPIAAPIPGEVNDGEGEIFDFTRLKNK